MFWSIVHSSGKTLKHFILPLPLFLKNVSFLQKEKQNKTKKNLQVLKLDPKIHLD